MISLGRDTSLSSVEIGNSVTFIGRYAFSGCKSLKEIKSLNPVPPTIQDDTFSNVDKDACKLTVPEEAVEAYKAAEYWKEFYNSSGIEGVATDYSESGKAFDLNGQRVGAEYKGIVIQNGKKLINK